MENSKIRILIKEPYKEPYEKEIEDTLENLQKIVGGHIECVGMPNIENVDLYVNEEGKLDKLAGNFWLPEYDDCAVGTIFMVGFDEESGDNISLSDKQIKECKKYISLYEIPLGLDLYKDFYLLQAYMKKQFKTQLKKKNYEEM